MGTFVFAVLSMVLAALVLLGKMFCADEGEHGPLLLIFCIEWCCTVWAFYILLVYAASHL